MYPGERGFVSLYFHQIVERGYGFPSSRVQPDRRRAQLRGQFDAMQRVIDLLAALLRIRRYEILMDGELNQVQPIAKRRPLELVQVGNRFAAHLPVQKFHAVESYPPGVFNHGLNGIFVPLEVLVGVCGDAEPGAPLSRRVCCPDLDTCHRERGGTELDPFSPGGLDHESHDKQKGEGGANRPWRGRHCRA